MKKLLLTGTIVLLTATSASAQSSIGAGGGMAGGMSGSFRSGSGFAVSAPRSDPRKVACLRAHGMGTAHLDQHAIAVAIQRCLHARR